MMGSVDPCTSLKRRDPEGLDIVGTRSLKPDGSAAHLDTLYGFLPGTLLGVLNSTTATALCLLVLTRPSDKTIDRGSTKLRHRP